MAAYVCNPKALEEYGMYVASLGYTEQAMPCLATHHILLKKMRVNSTPVFLGPSNILVKNNLYNLKCLGFAELTVSAEVPAPRLYIPNMVQCGFPETHLTIPELE